MNSEPKANKKKRRKKKKTNKLTIKSYVRKGIID